MLNFINTSTIRRVAAFLNATVVMFALVAVFILVNWRHMPSGLGGFLAMRITVKNLLISLICVSAGAIAFHGFGLTKPGWGASVRQEFTKVVYACAVTPLFPLLFPLTRHSRA